jgi:WD40 repeat protein
MPKSLIGELILISLEEYSKIEGVSEACWQFGISPDGQFLALSMASRPEVLQLCSLQGKVYKEFEGHRGMIHSISFSPDGRTLVSGSADKTVRIWSPTGELLSLFDRFDTSVESVSFAPQVSILAAGEKCGLIVLFDIGGNYIATLHSPKSRIYSLSWSDDNNYLAAGCADSNLYVYNIGFQMKKVYPHPGPVFGATFSPLNGNPIGPLAVISACEDGQIRLTNLDDGEQSLISSHEKRAVSVAFSPADNVIASVSFDKSIKFFDRQGNPQGEYQLDSEALGASFSRDGKRLFVSTKNRTLHMFNVVRK